MSLPAAIGGLHPRHTSELKIYIHRMPNRVHRIYSSDKGFAGHKAGVIHFAGEPA